MQLRIFIALLYFSFSTIIISSSKADELDNLDRSASLVGIDKDNNGICDDIDRYIIELSYTVPQTQALRQLAQSLQLTFITNTKDPAAMDRLRLASARAVNCVFMQFPENEDITLAGKLSEKLESLTTNTKPRMIAYLESAKASDGKVLPGTRGNTCN